jgi:hypothetical protein
VRPEGQSIWRRYAGRFGLGVAFATSAAMFVSALGGIASIDVGAEAARQVTPAVQTHEVRYDARDCPHHDVPKTETS